MKLSDAAVLGAATWKRICYYTRDPNDNTGCFLQLAIRAVGGDYLLWTSESNRLWPWLYQPCPAEYAIRPAGVEKHIDVIWYGNDCGTMSFEEILAYVRQHEPPKAPEQTKDVLEETRISDMELSTGERG